MTICNQKSKFVYGLIAIVLILFGYFLMKPGSTDSCHSKEISALNVTTNESQPETTLEQKRQFVKDIMIEAWRVYKRFILGTGELNQKSKQFHENYLANKKALSIVGSMSTLWTMDLKEEFKRAKSWIETEVDVGKFKMNTVRVYDVIVNLVGGLLSCYALTNETLFLNKALTIAQLTEPAFNTSTGLPYHFMNLNTTESWQWFNSHLSYKSGFQLDLNYLSDASGSAKYRNQIEKIQSFLLKTIKNPNDNLYSDSFDYKGRRVTYESSLFEDSGEFYISLVKSFIQSNYRDVHSIEMYKEALDAIDAAKMFVRSPGGLYYARNSDFKFEFMAYSGCYLGAMLSMGASVMQRALALNNSISEKNKSIEQNRITRHWHLAEQITETCQQSSVRTLTGLGPARFYYNQTNDVMPKFYSYMNYFLSAELAESNFILWRLTHKPKYRDNAWQMAQAIQRHCKMDGDGYSGILNVDRVPTNKNGQQRVEFLSSTLKYLYLTFTDDSLLSLDKWIFNAVGHPLPICGNNSVYQSCGFV